jgi:hypothetical protein
VLKNPAQPESLFCLRLLQSAVDYYARFGISIRRLLTDNGQVIAPPAFELLPHPSQPFILGFQLLILTPEVSHLLGNISSATPDQSASSLPKPNFVQAVSRRQTITASLAVVVPKGVRRFTRRSSAAQAQTPKLTI